MITIMESNLFCMKLSDFLQKELFIKMIGFDVFAQNDYNVLYSKIFAATSTLLGWRVGQALITEMSTGLHCSYETTF
jgi:hypothetical protein